MSTEDSDYKKLLLRYCKRGGDETKIHQPSIVDWNGKEWACATNAHSLILMPTNIVEGVARVEDWPDVSKVIPELPTKAIGKLTAKAIKEAIKGKEQYKVYFKKPCGDCDGEGSFDHGHHEYDCKHCHGEGTLNDGYSHSEYHYYERMKIGPSCVALPQLAFLLEAMELFGVDAEIMVNPAPDANGYGKANLFKVLDCYILIMPMVFKEDDKFTTVEI